MLSEFLNRMFGEDAEATANDATVNQVLVNSQKSRKRNTSPLPLPGLPACISIFLLTLLLRSAQRNAQSNSLCGVTCVIRAGWDGLKR